MKPQHHKLVHPSEWDALNRPEIQDFILKNKQEPVAKLALALSNKPDWPVRTIVQQIEGLQKFKTKVPIWHSCADIRFPPRVHLEQSSSQATAVYKASLVQGSELIDITGGMGVDAFFFAQKVARVQYIEANSALAAYSEHNFKALNQTNITVRIGNGLELITKNSLKVDILYVDPSRRDANNRKLVSLHDCEPDVIAALPMLQQKAHQILIKTSPMLDISKAINELGCVAEVHIVSVRNECKEVLYRIGSEAVDNPKVIAVNLLLPNEQTYTFTYADEQQCMAQYSELQQILFEPNTSILKSGAFKKVGADFGLCKLAMHTHLYTSDKPNDAFPGMQYQVLERHPWQPKQLKGLYKNRYLNIKTFQFPLSPEAVKQTLGCKDGGTDFLFAYTDFEGVKKIAIGKPVAL